MEQRAIIKFCFKLGKKFVETYELLEKFRVVIVLVGLKFIRGSH